MRGRVQPRPLGEIAAVAARVFTGKGYKAAGISDVAAGLGLSHGALYTYVDSKEALLYLAFLHLAEPEALAGLTIPVTSPGAAGIAEVDARSVASAGFPALDAALGRRSKPVADELGGIIDELYAYIEGHQGLLALVESCARDIPELAELHFVRGRRVVLDQLGDYLRRRIRSGHLRPVPDVATSARFLVESVAWFAWHRHGDQDSSMLKDDDCRRTVRHLVLAAFLPAEPSPGGNDDDADG
ncbi:TetR/AcrR family transcriptional regulator [Amycolatopsis sp. WQ 127309]|uniref:TetR/AcrR family transcriptional regulator n=1 Tax=Amycolatopsis sp. WQ 127309 TaxID=2932773 RepID=UPI001FF5EDFE|nr:TetR/AcrR family transcriptional regulator [Amycolatopsis sp. WQ 127309]UOZ03652.1 TetR/AcrR family transcriptional regulator [Amycolatopsis sp. WQ 127309]